MFQALESRNYRLFFYGQVISLCGTWVQSVAQGWLVLRLTNSPLYLGLVSAAASIPVVLLSLPGGIVADWFDKRKILLVSQYLVMILSALLAILTLTDTIRIEHVLFIAFLSGAANAFEAPSRQALTIDLAGRDNLTNAIALNSTMFNAARTLGPAIAGVLVAEFGEGTAFALNALSFLAVIYALSLIQFPTTQVSTSHGSARDGIIELFRYLRGHRLIRALLMAQMGLSFFGYSFIPLLPLIARDVVQTDVMGFGWLSASSGFGALAAALGLAIFGDRIPRGKWMITTLFMFPFALLVFSQSTSLVPAAVATACIGYCGVSSLALVNTLIQTVVDQEYRGRIMSLFVLSLMGLSPLGGLFAGAISEHLMPVQYVILSCAVLSFLSALYAVARNPELFQLR